MDSDFFNHFGDKDIEIRSTNIERKFSTSNAVNNSRVFPKF